MLIRHDTISAYADTNVRSILHFFLPQTHNKKPEARHPEILSAPNLTTCAAHILRPPLVTSPPVGRWPFRAQAERKAAEYQRKVEQIQASLDGFP